VRLAVFGCGTIGGSGDTFPRKSRTKVVHVASERPGSPDLPVRLVASRAAAHPVRLRLEPGSKLVSPESPGAVLASVEPGG